MNKPAWMQQVLKQQQAQLRGLDNVAPAVNMHLKNRTPGWRFIKEEVSCIPDSLYPWDPKVVKAIREISPDLVPIWIRRVFHTPYTDSRQETVVFGRHGIGQIVRKSYHVPISVSMPSGSNLPKPNAVYWYPVGDNDPRARDLPGAYIPFDWRFYKHVKANFRDWSKEEIRALTIGRFENEEAAMAKQQAENDRIQAEHQRYVNKKLEQVSEVEFKEYFMNKLHNKQ